MRVDAYAAEAVLEPPRFELWRPASRIGSSDTARGSSGGRNDVVVSVYELPTPLHSSGGASSVWDTATSLTVPLSLSPSLSFPAFPPRKPNRLLTKHRNLVLAGCNYHLTSTTDKHNDYPHRGRHNRVWRWVPGLIRSMAMRANRIISRFQKKTGGSCGCVVAGRLANLDPKLKVLLIEAGESELLLSTRG